MTFKDDIKQWFCSVMLYIQSFSVEHLQCRLNTIRNRKNTSCTSENRENQPRLVFFIHQVRIFHACMLSCYNQFGSYTGVW